MDRYELGDGEGVVFYVRDYALWPESYASLASQIPLLYFLAKDSNDLVCIGVRIAESGSPVCCHEVTRSEFGD